jgi:hypothetical protein
MVPRVPVLGVQEDRPEVFPVVVVRGQQLPGELGRRLGVESVGQDVGACSRATVYVTATRR